MKYERFNTIPLEHYALYLTTRTSKEEYDHLHAVFLLKDQACHVGNELLNDPDADCLGWALDPVTVYIIDSVDEEDLH
mgnify:CR=1 FL=1